MPHRHRHPHAKLPEDHWRPARGEPRHRPIRSFSVGCSNTQLGKAKPPSRSITPDDFMPAFRMHEELLLSNVGCKVWWLALRMTKCSTTDFAWSRELEDSRGVGSMEAAGCDCGEKGNGSDQTLKSRCRGEGHIQNLMRCSASFKSIGDCM